MHFTWIYIFWSEWLQTTMKHNNHHFIVPCLSMCHFFPPLLQCGLDVFQKCAVCFASSWTSYFMSTLYTLFHTSNEPHRDSLGSEPRPPFSSWPAFAHFGPYQPSHTGLCERVHQGSLSTAQTALVWNNQTELDHFNVERLRPLRCQMTAKIMLTWHRDAFCKLCFSHLNSIFLLKHSSKR